jgi:hypothetical protein
MPEGYLLRAAGAETHPYDGAAHLRIGEDNDPHLGWIESGKLLKPPVPPLQRRR